MKLIKSFKRRSFLKMATLATAAGATSAFASTNVLREATSEEVKNPYPGSKLVKTICSYCSVGCGVVAEVHNGVWVRQEVAQDHPISHGGHCCKGADMIDKARATNRLKYPMEKVAGKWQRSTWDDSMGKISEKLLKLRQEHGPDSVQIIGSSKLGNEQAYYLRKFAAMFGTNNIDQQARICHSPTVAGVANTWGYGAMTNHIGDMQNSKAIIIIGANPASNHPIAMQHILKAKEQNGAKIIVVDPRYTKTAAKSDIFCRVRPGSDIAFMYGMIRLIKHNGWLDKSFINDRVYGMDEILAECEAYTPEHVEDLTGCPKEDLIQATTVFAQAEPGSLIWNQGLTQHTIGSSNTRLATIVQLALGNMGKTGGGCNILRGHDNVQGATDLGCLAHTLPGYYGLSENSWRYFSDQWNVDYDWMQSRFKTKELMETPGFSLSLWLHGVLEESNAKNNGGSSLKALVVIGNGISTVTQTHKIKEALDKLELVVFIDPFVNDATVLTSRKDNLFILPVSTQVETSGSIVNTSRTIQWRSKVIDPLYESRPDHEILFDLAKRLGFYDEFVAGMGKGDKFNWPEDATDEIAKALKTIGMQGRTAKRIKKHTDNWHLFDSVSLKGKGDLSKEYYGLPWPCWDESHPGSPVLYNVNLAVSQGGMGFRARFGLERDGVDLLAAKGVAPKGSRIKGGYAEITDQNVEELTGVKLTSAEKKAVKGKNWKTDDSGILTKYALQAGLAPYGNARARTIVWNFTDAIPKHREPLHTPRPDLISQYPSVKDKTNFYRADVRYESEQNAQEWVKEYPTSIVSGRIVEHFGSGTETRASKYLAELSPEMYGEVHPNFAASLGIKDGEMMWVYGTSEGRIKVKCKYSYTVAENYVFLPQNFSGIFQGESLEEHYPEGTKPYMYGESSNSITSYGFDQETGCPETKCSLVRLERA